MLRAHVAIGNAISIQILYLLSLSSYQIAIESVWKRKKTGRQAQGIDIRIRIISRDRDMRQRENAYLVKTVGSASVDSWCSPVDAIQDVIVQSS